MQALSQMARSLDYHKSSLASDMAANAQFLWPIVRWGFRSSAELGSANAIEFRIWRPITWWRLTRARPMPDVSTIPATAEEAPFVAAGLASASPPPRLLNAPLAAR